MTNIHTAIVSSRLTIPSHKLVYIESGRPFNIRQSFPKVLFDGNSFNISCSSSCVTNFRVCHQSGVYTPLVDSSFYRTTFLPLPCIYCFSLRHFPLQTSFLTRVSLSKDTVKSTLRFP